MTFTVYQQNILFLVSKYRDSMVAGRPYSLTIKRWYKPKTTGPNSQLNHIWGHATQIGECSGCSPREVIDQAREDAMSKGYSTKMNFAGRIKPVRISEANTQDAGYVIDQLHEYASFLNVRLIENEENI